MLAGLYNKKGILIGVMDSMETEGISAGTILYNNSNKPYTQKRMAPSSLRRGKVK